MPSKFVTSCIHPCRAICQRPCEGLANSSPNQASSNSSAIPDIKFFPPTPSCMHPQSIFWCSSGSGKPAEPAYPPEKRQRESNKARSSISIPFCACQPLPSVEASENPSMKALYKKPEEISKCLVTNERKKPPNYKFLGGEAEETGDP